MPRKSRNSRKSLKGGNSTSFPSEYYGNVSGNYHEVVPAQESTGPYGEYVGQSYGEPFGDNMTGPNLFYHPNTSNTMTGGSRRRSGSRSRSTSRRSKGSSGGSRRRSTSRRSKGSSGRRSSGGSRRRSTSRRSKGSSGSSRRRRTSRRSKGTKK